MKKKIYLLKPTLNIYIGVQANKLLTIQLQVINIKKKMIKLKIIKNKSNI